MANGAYACINENAIKGKQIPNCIGGVSRNTKEGWACVYGVSRLFFKAGTPLKKIEVGTSVYMNVDGVLKEFIIVHQGRPSAEYDISCDGTWLLMKDIYLEMKFDNSDNNYIESDIHSYLNNTFINLFDSDIQSVIRQVKIPYTHGTGSNGTVHSGVNGLSTKAFLLSFIEIGGKASEPTYANAEGAVLDYFEVVSDSNRVAYLNGKAVYWGLRSPITGGYHPTTAFHGIANAGWLSNQGCTYTTGVRPALILPSSTVVDENFNIIA